MPESDSPDDRDRDARDSTRVIFISYSHQDRTLAQALDASLTSLGIKTFLDLRDIAVGESIPDRIYESIGDATELLYLVSSHSVVSPWVREELGIAKVRQKEAEGFGILPILVDDAQVPLSVRHIRYADFRGWQDYTVYRASFLLLANPLGVDPILIEGPQVEWWLEHWHRYSPAIRELEWLLGRADLAVGYAQFFDGGIEWVFRKARTEDLQFEREWQRLAAAMSPFRDVDRRMGQISLGLERLSDLLQSAARHGTRSDVHERALEFYGALSRTLNLLYELDREARLVVTSGVKTRGTDSTTTSIELAG